MQIAAEAIVCAVRPHGEHGAVVRALTAEHGLLAGYVRGARSRLLRPVLMPGHVVAAVWRARTADQLSAMTVELAHSRAGLLGEPLAAAAVAWVTALTASALPEGQPYAALHSGLDGLLTAVEHAPAARQWAPALVRYESLMLAALGYGDDLAPTHDLATALRRNRAAIGAHLLGPPRDRSLLDLRDRLTDRLNRAVA